MKNGNKLCKTLFSYCTFLSIFSVLCPVPSIQSIPFCVSMLIGGPKCVVQYSQYKREDFASNQIPSQKIPAFFFASIHVILGHLILNSKWKYNVGNSNPLSSCSNKVTDLYIVDLKLEQMIRAFWYLFTNIYSQFFPISFHFWEGLVWIIFPDVDILRQDRKRRCLRPKNGCKLVRIYWVKVRNTTLE